MSWIRGSAWIERLPSEQNVVGSNPSGSAFYFLFLLKKEIELRIYSLYYPQ